MKRILSLCLALTVLLSCVPALAADDTGEQFDANIDYMQRMLDSAILGTDEALKAGARYEELRNMKIMAMASAYATTSFFTDYESALEIENAIRAYQGMPLRSEDKVADDATTSTEQAEVTYTVTASVLNCRLAPSASASVVARFSKGTELISLDEIKSGFAKVQSGNITGWCSLTYLQENKPAPVVPEPKPEPPKPTYTQEDLEWLALAIHREAGSSWICDERQLLVGNVVLNRVAADYYPDTIKGVLTQRGQYPWAKNPYAAGKPSQRCYDNALRLLNGERFCPENVVYQAEFRQGHGVYKTFYDPVLHSTTYFCYR